MDWIWVDTCCINQSSSAELSESINSMFRWYGLAAVCYAYLSDVHVPHLHNKRNAMEFQSSGWFKRAWTLQELLAPKHVVFFSSYWQDLGTKVELSSLVSEVTRIDQEYLTSRRDNLPDRVTRPTTIKAASLAKRMSWAVGRQATRPEDIAYSLLGIFDVNMPLLYGEGKEKAFFRLQEEIMKDSDDHSLLVWATSSNEYAPPDLVPGRESAHSRHFAFATSPEDFVNMGNIVPFVSQEGDLPYNTTNRGLQISLPVGPMRTKYYQKLPMAMDQSEASTSDMDPNSNHLFAANTGGSRSRSRSAGTRRNQSRSTPPDPRFVRRASADEDLIQVGVLRCHVEHDFFHVVAIPLKPLGGNNYERQTDIPPGLVQEWRTRQFTRKTIYIKMDDEGVDRSLSFDRRHGLLVRTWPQLYHLRQVYPPEYWREKDSIIQPLGMRQSERPWYASLLFIDEIEGGPPFIVTLGVVHGPSIEDGLGRPKAVAWPWCRVHVIYRGSFYLDDVHNKTEYTPGKLSDVSYLADRRTISVRLKSSKVLGQEMYLVDMNISNDRAADSPDYRPPRARKERPRTPNFDTDEGIFDFENYASSSTRDPEIRIQVGSRSRSPSLR
jgi:hypothetical protein